MKWTYEWLCEYLDTDCLPIDIEQTLNRIGLEVEDFILPISPVIAKIIECKEHENSDHLHVLKVDDGSGSLHQIVCGAPNAKVGLVSALAKPGCKIGDTIIQSGKLRGVTSDGMMCSGYELGINNDNSGIIEFDENQVVLGQPVPHIYSSPIFETSITPNRPDYLSVRGIAYDLAASGIGKIKEQKITDLQYVSGERKIEIKNNDRCPTYRFCEIRGIKNINSNTLISNRLISAGIKPKNVAIDTTNYICYDMGQPMHCFDADKVNGDIIVRNAQKNEKFTDLFGKEHELNETDLVIADTDGILALAGVIGGARAMTTEETTNIILESAYFEPVGIRKTSKSLGISTDASYRYERGIDANLSGKALAMAVKFIQESCGGQIVNVSLAGIENFVPNEIIYNPQFFLQKSGIDMLKEEQYQILSNLRYNIRTIDKNTWGVTPHSSRIDVTASENIVSDLLRIYGYDKLGINGITETTDFQKNILESKTCLNIKKILSNRGLNENVSFGFGNSKIEKLLSTKDIIFVANPIITDLDCARNSLLGNLLIALSNNIKRGYPDINIYELGTVFDGEQPEQEHTEICILRSGETGQKHWLKRNRTVDVFDVKSDILALLGNQKYTIEIDNAPLWAHPYKYGRIMQGKKQIAEFGELHPSVAQNMHIKVPTVIGIINDINNLPTKPKNTKIQITDFQPITRDFAFITDLHFPADKIVTSAMSVDSRISNVVIFDSFDMGNGKKSIAFTITIIPTANMTDDDLQKIQTDVINNVQKKCPAQIRDK